MLATVPVNVRTAPPISTRRILHLRTISGRGGGPEKTLLATPHHIGSNYDVRLAYFRPQHDPEYNMPERARELGVSLIDLAETGPIDPRSVWRLAREIRRFRPHVLHAHDYKTNVIAILLGKVFGIPAVTTLHGYVTRGGRLDLYYRIDRWALRRMRHLVAVSPDLDEFLCELGIPAARRTLAENGIDTEHFRRRVKPAECKHLIGCRSDRLLVGAIGRLQPEKGFDDLIHAAARLLDQGMKFDLIIAGSGPEHGRLEALVKALGRQENIRLPGYCDRVVDLYQALDVFVSSSLREGLPNVLLEAMALVVPVLATRIAGVPRLVQHEINGLLVSPGNHEALADELARLLRDEVLRTRLGEAGRRTVEDRYSFSRRMEKIRRVYDGVLGELSE